jgi:8-oxo-dGTP pyrophosphatase MutT (NUDIX family)
MTYQHWRALTRRGATQAVMMRQFDPAAGASEPSYDLDIDDPWYGGPEDFEAALDQIEAAADGIVKWVGDKLNRERDPADTWYDCTCGKRHWGQFGAAGLLVYRDDAVLLQLRAARSHQGGTWALPGGARKTGERALATALREAQEEVGLDPALVAPEWWRVVSHGGWAYTTVVARGLPGAQTGQANWETEATAWVPVDEVADLDLHPGLAEAWPQMRPLLGRRLTLIVDGANVVGAKPDGWWKDRAGAAERLRDLLSQLARDGLAQVLVGPAEEPSGWWPNIVLVVEGAAKGIDRVDGVNVVEAPGEGDDEIVRQAERHPGATVVTADKALGERLRAVGAQVMSPGALRRALP